MIIMNEITTSIQGLQATLDQVFQTMLGLCGSLTGIGQSIAGFAALWYIAYRVWKHRREGIDIFPLLYPFVIGICLSIYPSLIGIINSILQPTVQGTSALVSGASEPIAALLKQKEALIEQGAEWQMYIGSSGSGDFDKWSQYTGNTQSGPGTAFGLSNWVRFELAKTAYNVKNSFKLVLSEFLEVLFQAAALCINTIRVFYLVVLAIIGPLVFGLSVYEPFRSSLASWLSKYVHVFLWLPVCNIFAMIINQVQVQMLKIDIAQLQAAGQTWFGQTDVAYLVFLFMGIAGYFSVPMITQHIITVSPRIGGHVTQVVKTANNIAGKAAAAMI
jgi:conjugative transposon TraJ protein